MLRSVSHTETSKNSFLQTSNYKNIKMNTYAVRTYLTLAEALNRDLKCDRKHMVLPCLYGFSFLGILTKNAGKLFRRRNNTFLH